MRMEDYKPIFNTILAVNPKWIKEITITYEDDDWVEEKLSTTLIVTIRHFNISISNGLLRYKRRLCITKNRGIVRNIVIDFDDTKCTRTLESPNFFISYKTTTQGEEKLKTKGRERKTLPEGLKNYKAGENEI